MKLTLEKIGLSDKEARVYLASLELAKDTAQNIARKSRINRPTTYVILEKLMKMGLISSLREGKKTYFVAESPRELENLLKGEETLLKNKKDELNAVMNRLLMMHKSKGEKPVVRYFEGAEGLEAMDRYEKKFVKNSEMLFITPIDMIENMFPIRRSKSLNERVDSGIKARSIYTRESGPFSKEENDKQLRDGIRISRKKYPLNATFTIIPEWGIKMYYFDKENPYGVIIESEALAKNMKLLFELAWLGAKLEYKADTL